jgi:hypothetical protein
MCRDAFSTMIAAQIAATSMDATAGEGGCRKEAQAGIKSAVIISGGTWICKRLAGKVVEKRQMCPPVMAASQALDDRPSTVVPLEAVCG